MININEYLRVKTASAATSDLLFSINSKINGLKSNYENKLIPKSFLSKVPGLNKVESSLSNLTSKGLDKLGLKQKINVDELKENVSNLRDHGVEISKLQDNEELWQNKRELQDKRNESINRIKNYLDRSSNKNDPYLFEALQDQYKYSNDENAMRELQEKGVPEKYRNNMIKSYQRDLEEANREKLPYHKEPKKWTDSDFKLLGLSEDKSNLDDLMMNTQSYITNETNKILRQGANINMNDLPALESGYKKQHLNSLISSGVGLTGTAGLVGGIGYAGSKLYKGMKKPLAKNIIKESPRVESAIQQIEEAPKTNFIDKSVNWIKENPKPAMMLAGAPLSVYALNKMVSNEREEAVRKDRMRY